VNAQIQQMEAAERSAPAAPVVPAPVP
jgi:hypothetical protein